MLSTGTITVTKGQLSVGRRPRNRSISPRWGHALDDGALVIPGVAYILVSISVNRYGASKNQESLEAGFICALSRSLLAN